MGSPDQFALTRISMNPDRVVWRGWVFKLTYVLSDPKAPVLEAFRASETSRAEDWDIYGAPSSADKVTLTFAGEGATCQMVDPKGILEITLVEVGSEVFDYARTGPKSEPRFVFQIELR